MYTAFFTVHILFGVSFGCWINIDFCERAKSYSFGGLVAVNEYT